MAEKFKEPDKIRQYVEALEANLHKATGKSLAQWVKIARTCPHTKTRERLKWLKDKHGLGQNRGSLVLWRAFGGEMLGSDDNPEHLVDRLFDKSFAAQRPLYEKVAAYIRNLGSGTVSPRKSFVAFYRLKQYAAVKPSKKGLMLAMALAKYPKDMGFVEAKAVGNQDRNRMALILTSEKDFSPKVRALLKDAYSQA